VALILADVLLPEVVVIVNEIVRAPAGIVTEAGTCARAGLSLDKLITAPAGGAAPFNVIVPVDGEPGETVLGFNTSELLVRPAGFTVRLVVLVVPP
jgi:hypothetical protein